MAFATGYESAKISTSHATTIASGTGLRLKPNKDDLYPTYGDGTNTGIAAATIEKQIAARHFDRNQHLV
ncbi:MAG: hypothetical protein ISR99_01990 [Parcubacteria group bacterium]|nr:hypothetical protein [Parcubacteria group bacterium]